MIVNKATRAPCNVELPSTSQSLLPRLETYLVKETLILVMSGRTYAVLVQGRGPGACDIDPAMRLAYMQSTVM
jgi:hypothetical protein